MKIEVDKYYMTRDGRKAYVYKQDKYGSHPFFFVVLHASGATCTKEGLVGFCEENEKDLVSLWEDGFST